MNTGSMKRRIAAALCAAMLTSTLAGGALAEGANLAQDASVATQDAAQGAYKKFKLKAEMVEGVLCASVSGADPLLDVTVSVLNEKGDVIVKDKVREGSGTLYFRDLAPGVYTVRAKYIDEAAAKAVKAVTVEIEIIDEEAERRAAEEAAAQQAAAEEAARKAEEERLAAEAAAQQAAAEEAARKAEEERLAAEAAAAQQAEAERQAAEAAAAQQAEAERQAAEAAAAQQAEAERQAAEAAAAQQAEAERQAAEAAAAQQAAADAAQQSAEPAAQSDGQTADADSGVELIVPENNAQTQDANTGVELIVPENNTNTQDANAGVELIVPENNAQTQDANAGVELIVPENNTNTQDANTGVVPITPENNTNTQDANAGVVPITPENNTNTQDANAGVVPITPENNTNTQDANAGVVPITPENNANTQDANAGVDSTTPGSGAQPIVPTTPGSGAQEAKLSVTVSVSGHTVTAVFSGNMGTTIECGLFDATSMDPYDADRGLLTGVSDTATVTFTDVPAGQYVVSGWYNGAEGGFVDEPVEVRDESASPAPAQNDFSVVAEAGGESSVKATVSGAQNYPVRVDLIMPDTTKQTQMLASGNGDVMFADLKAGAYTIMASYDGEAASANPIVCAPVELAGSAPVDPVVPPTPAASQFSASVAVNGDGISVTVTGASERDVAVSLSMADLATGQQKVLAGGNGTAEFTGLAAGTYTVRVDYATPVEGVKAFEQAGVTVAKPQQSGLFTLDVTQAKGTLNVTISGALSQAIGVQLTKPDGSSAFTTVDAGNGTASFTGLEKGEYSVYADYMTPIQGVKTEVEKTGIQLAEGADVVTIVPGQFKVDVAASAGLIAVTVSEANAQAVDVVLIRPDNTTDVRQLAAGNGTMTFENLAAGTYSVVVAYQTEVQGVSSVKREGIAVSAAPSTAGAIVATAQAGVGRVDVSVTAASKLPVAITLMQGGVIRDTRRIEAGVGAVAFTDLPAGAYSVSIDYAPSQAGVNAYVIDQLQVIASVAPIAITGITAGDNKITVTGTAQPNTDVTVTTNPAGTTAIVRSDARGAYTAELVCGAGTYTAIYAQYGADAASRVTVNGTFVVTTPATAPSLTVDRIDPTTMNIVARTNPGVIVKLTTSDYTQTVTADARGILRFYLPHTYAYGSSIAFTVYYGANNSLSYQQTEGVTDARTYHLLKRGSHGRGVFELTARLSELGYPVSARDNYDDSVVAAVRMFQANNGLAVDGIAGILTHNLVFSVAAIGFTESTYPTLVRGDRGLALIYALQQRLKDLGYYTIRVDGIFGSGTQRAVREFQATNGLTPNGVADNTTQKLLYSSAAKAAGSAGTGSYTTLSRSNRYNAQVATLQRRLKALGYPTGSVDGYFGSNTYRAVRAFQSRNGLSVTGVADPATQQLLYSAAAKAYSSSSSSPSTSTGYRLLYWGCKGDAVRRLQQALLDAGYKQVRTADGIFGQWTYDGVRAFQKANGLSVDGIAGKNTQNKLYGTNY